MALTALRATAVLTVVFLLAITFRDAEGTSCVMARMDPGLQNKLTPAERERCAELLDK
jgi:hypothetical protein